MHRQQVGPAATKERAAEGQAAPLRKLVHALRPDRRMVYVPSARLRAMLQVVLATCM